MKTAKIQKPIYCSIEDYEANCYLFSPSISKRRTVNGKSYYVRSYFASGQDFEKTMQRLATQQVNKNAR